MAAVGVPMSYTHADLIAAIDRLSRDAEGYIVPRGLPVLADTLRAILDLCGPWHPKDPERGRIYPHEVLPVVADALRKMGVL